MVVLDHDDGDEISGREVDDSPDIALNQSKEEGGGSQGQNKVRALALKMQPSSSDQVKEQDLMGRLVTRERSSPPRD